MRLHTLRRLQCPPVRAAPSTPRQCRRLVFSSAAAGSLRHQPRFRPPICRGLVTRRWIDFESAPCPGRPRHLRPGGRPHGRTGHRRAGRPTRRPQSSGSSRSWSFWAPSSCWRAGWGGGA